MGERSAEEAGRRVLIFAPTGRDAALTQEILARAGLESHRCAAVEDVCAAVAEGAGVLLLAEEALAPPATDCLNEEMERQPAWSDLPVVVFAQGGDHPGLALETLGALGNITILERPVRIATLITTVRTALRARRRQYEVRDLLQRLEDTARRKDEFLAMLGHELRNPLGAMRNALQVLAAGGPRPEREARQLDLLDRQTRHLSRIVDDLLDVSRVTLGKIDLQRHRVDLKQAVERCMQSLSAAAEAQRHQLSLSAGMEAVEVDGDPVRLEQVVSNLLSNAIKYTPAGGKIEVLVRREGERAVLRVRDTGVGIPAEMQPHIFDLFAQGDTSLARSRGGLGIGLTLVKNLVQLHGGSVAVQSDGPGRGSEFVVRLPIASPRGHPGLRIADRSDGSDRSTIRDPQSALRILIIEDNPDGREALRDLLELWGHEVDVAENGPLGVDLALARTPQAALVDIGLPEMDGYEVALRIRAGADGRGPYLVAVTGYGQPEDRDRALAAGFQAHLVKPVDPAELKRVLEQVDSGK